MQLFELNVTDAIPYENNPRINEAAIKAVKNSIREFGFKVPILVDCENVIIAGHSRVMAAKELGMAVVPAIRVEDLSEEQVRAFRLADNKAAEYALWDNEKLTEELDAIATMDMTELFGFFDEHQFRELDSTMQQPDSVDSFFIEAPAKEAEGADQIEVIVTLDTEEECETLIQFLQDNAMCYLKRAV